MTEMQYSVSAGVMEMDKFAEQVRGGVREIADISVESRAAALRKTPVTINCPITRARLRNTGILSEFSDSHFVCLLFCLGLSFQKQEANF